MIEKEYFGSLDVLRFFAFMCVFISHIFLFFDFQFSHKFLHILTPYMFTQGNLGVTFFFVLSGFLITYLLFTEQINTGSINIGNFYIRRVLRIWPPYFLVVFIGFFLIPGLVHIISIFGLDFHTLLAGTELSKLPKFLFFLANFNNNVAYFLAVLWSISIEEQFYLFWPLCLSLFKKRNLLVVFAILYVTSFVYRLIHADNIGLIRGSTISVISDFISGAFSAYIIIYFPQAKRAVEKAGKSVGYMLGLLILLYFIANKTSELHILSDPTLGARILTAAMPVFGGIIFSFAVVFASFTPHKFLTSKLSSIFEYLGRRSYGLYCYHALGILTVKALLLTHILTFTGDFKYFILKAILSFTLTVIAAAVSYRYIEKPILALKNRIYLRYSLLRA